MRARLIGIAYLAVWRVSRWLPERVAVRMFERLSMRSWRRNARQREVVTANLAPVVGPEALETTVREAFRSYGRYWAETFRMSDLSDATLLERITHERIEVADDVFAAGKGGIVVVPHIGNWDAGGRWACLRWRLTVVAEVLKPRMVFKRFLKHRQALGMSVVPLERGSDVAGTCMEYLARGDLVALVCDRDMSDRGIEVTMFGRRTTLPAGPAVIAERAGVPILPGCVFQAPGGRWHIVFQDAVPVIPGDVAKTMQGVADAFERFIARAPEQWHVFAGRYWRDA